MKKQSSILAFALSLFFFSVVMGGNAQAQKTAKSDVSVSRTISAGQYSSDGKPMVVVTITINKYEYTGPGRIEENFSSDYQAVLISSSRATFQASSGKAVFIWSNIQEDRVITVSYALEALGKTAANQTVSGQFFYQNQTFNIEPNPTSFTLDVSNLPAYKPVAASNTSTLDDLFSTVTGNQPQSAPAPAANTAIEPSSNNAAPTANSSQLPMQQQPATTTPTVSTPVQQNTPVATAPVQQSAPEATTAPAQQNTPVTMAPVQQSAPEATTAPAQQNTPVTTAPVQQSAPEATTAPAQQNTPVATAPVQQSAPEATTAPATTSSAGNMVGQGDLIYRVQIIVVGDKSKLPRFLRQYKITDQVYYDPSNDQTPVRVMVGNYSDYNSAKARCNQLKSKGLTEAFVAPYYMGQRIGMDEAAKHIQH